MFPYDSIEQAIVDTFRLSAEEMLAVITHDFPARISTFWNTNGVMIAGISWAQTIAAVISAISVYIIVVSVMNVRAMKMRGATKTSSDVGNDESVVPEPDAGTFRGKWNEITGYLSSPHEAEWKIAVIEADKLVDDALMRAGFSGETFGDRLTNIQPGVLASLDGLWWAHKVRNRLAHEVDYFLRYTEARQAIMHFQVALEELKFLS